jgi:hypothetical protein
VRERPRSGEPAESASDDHHARSMPSGRRHEHRVTGVNACYTRKI